MAVKPEPAGRVPPGRLRAHLPLWAFGLEGPWLGRHVAEGLAGLAAVRPEYTALHRALTVWRFERQPLAAGCARAMLALGREGVNPGQRALARTLAPRLGPPATAGDWPALRDNADRSVVSAVLGRRMDDPISGLYWRGRALEYALTAGLPDLAEAAVAPLARDPALAPLVPRLLAEVAATFGRPEAVLAALERVDETLFPRFTALARGDALVRAGDQDSGTATLVALWRRESWHPGLTVRVHELLFPVRPVPVHELPGRVFVALYTWNRADRLARTLDSLAASRLGPARVVVLDNGATDATARVCRAAAARFAPGVFETLTLPVNLGAPAARNWLARVLGPGPEDFLAYVDDDVVVPPDWLERLAGALLADPGAEVVGARILAGDTTVVQSADVRLLAPEGRHTVRPLRNCPVGPDFGLLAATRPCASVSGCCHMLRGRALAGAMPFDLRFSPSQFDDLARDVGAFLDGGRCVLAGSLAVAHHQPAPVGGIADRGRIAGARVKLDGLFPAPDMIVAANRDLDTAWGELESKWERLARRLSRACTGGD